MPPLCFLLALLSAAMVPPASGEKPSLVPPAVGAKVADFSLTDVAGRRHALGDYKDKKSVVVVFIGNECPISNLCLVTLAEMQRKYMGKGVQFLAVNSNDQDPAAAVAAHARERQVPFPVLKDDHHLAADALGASRTPEAFLLDSRQVIRYHGRIDDQYGYRYRRAAPSRTELKDAIEQLLAGKPVTIAQTEVQGCIIGRTKKPSR